MNGIEYELLTKFLKMKPLNFQGTESKDASNLLLISMKGCNMRIMKKYRVEFLTFWLENDANQ